MTFEDFRKGLKRMSDYFPTFKPTEANERAWFHALEDTPVPVFYAALQIITRSETTWYPGNNLVAWVEKHRGEACRIAREAIEERRVKDPRRMLEPAMSEAERRENFKRLGELLSDTVNRMPTTQEQAENRT